MSQGMGSYYSPAAAAYGSLSAASMAAAAAAAQQTAMSAGLGSPAQVRKKYFIYHGFLKFCLKHDT